MLTCRIGPVLLGGLAGLAVAEPIHGQDPKGVVNMGRQAQLHRGDGPGHLCQVGPNTWLVEQILILDQELWGNVLFFFRKKITESASDILWLSEDFECFLLSVGLLCSSPGIQVSRTLRSVWSVISRSVGGSGLSMNPTTDPKIRSKTIATVHPKTQRKLKIT